MGACQNLHSAGMGSEACLGLQSLHILQSPEGGQYWKELDIESKDPAPVTVGPPAQHFTSPKPPLKGGKSTSSSQNTGACKDQVR